MKRHLLVVAALLALTTAPSYAQFGKLKQMININKDKNKKEEPADSTTAKPKKGIGGFWNKAVGSLAKVAASVGGGLTGMVTTTANLSAVEPQAFVMTNLHSRDVNVLQQTFFNGWQPGGNAVMLMFSSKNSIQLNKIDGEVLIDGAPANYVTMGVYSAFLKDNTSPKQVSIKTSSGQSAAFTLNPPQHKLKLLSINGQAANTAVDLTKDVTLEIETSGPKNDNTPVLVWLTGQTLGLRTFYEVGWFAPKSKITVPAAMFRNMNGVGNNIGFSNAYLQVSRSAILNASNVTGAFPSVKYASMVTDGQFINVTAKPVFNKGVEIKEEEKAATGNKLALQISKKHALMSPPLSRIKRIGAISFLIQGTSSFYEQKDDRWMQTRTTKQAEFPVFPADVYQGIMDEIYPQIMDVMKRETGAEIIPIEKITGSNAYQSTQPYMNIGSKSEPDYTFTYKNTKAMVGLKPVGQSAGYNSPEHKIMLETGANALIRVTLNLDMNFEGDKALIIPRLVYEIPGETLGETYTSTYVTGTVTGTPYKIARKGKLSADALKNEVLKSADLIEGFAKSIQQIKAKENANADYAAVWQAMFN